MSESSSSADAIQSNRPVRPEQDGEREGVRRTNGAKSLIRPNKNEIILEIKITIEKIDKNRKSIGGINKINFQLKKGHLDKVKTALREVLEGLLKPVLAALFDVAQYPQNKRGDFFIFFVAPMLDELTGARRVDLLGTGVGGAIATTGPDQKELGHAAHILAERKEAPQKTVGPAGHRPRNWDEAVAQVPGLRRWAEVKREGLAAGHELRDVLIVHLRDKVHGVGYWTASESPISVRALHFDQTLRNDIGQPARWRFPSDICIISGVRGRPVGSKDTVTRKNAVEQPTVEELRHAWRIINRKDRLGVKS